MNWLDNIKIGRDVTTCPDCDLAYEVLDEFLAQKPDIAPEGANWLDEGFSEEYYIALRCPKCLETRHFRLKSLTQRQYLDMQK